MKIVHPVRFLGKFQIEYGIYSIAYNNLVKSTVPARSLVLPILGTVILVNKKTALADFFKKSFCGDDTDRLMLSQYQ